MCWFHVMKDIKEAIKRLRIPDELATMIKNDIQDLHVSLNFDQFKSQLDHIKIKWAQYTALNELTIYFFKEWVCHNETWSSWSLWQIFQTPAGVAKTNNPIESFNKQI